MNYVFDILSLLGPISIWGYLFSYIGKGENIFRTKIIYFIFFGFLSVLGIFLLDKYFLDFPFLVSIGFGTLLSIFLIFQIFFLKNFKILQIILPFSFISIFLGIYFFIKKEENYFLGISYLTFFYYFLGSFLEEFFKNLGANSKNIKDLSKDNGIFKNEKFEEEKNFQGNLHESKGLKNNFFMTKKFDDFQNSTSRKDLILGFISVALSFAFFENLLFFLEGNISGKDLFFRGIYSISLHIFCASLSFLGIFLANKKERNLVFKYFLIPFSFLFLAVLIHFFYNIFAVSEKGFFMGIILIFSYFSITGIFMRN